MAKSSFRISRNQTAMTGRNGLNATECALCLERSVNQSLLELHKLATEKNDSQLCNFTETHYLNEQVEATKNWVTT